MTLSVFGVRLGMPADEAGRRATEVGARFSGFMGTHVTYKSKIGMVYVQVDGAGNVVSVAGPRLEADGRPVARAGTPHQELVAQLGEPEHRSPVEFDRLMEELEHSSPDLADGLEDLAAQREFWWYHQGALSILVDGRGAWSFHLQGR